jgi:hypothetical protein
MAAKKKRQSEKKAPEDIKREPFRQKLPVTLTKEEVAERARRAAHLVSDHDVKAEGFKQEAAANKQELKKIDTEIRGLSDEVRSGRTYRDVPCERVYNWTVGSVTDIRTDTGEVLAERAMSDAERQKALPFPKPQGSDDLDDDFEDGEPEKKPEEPTDGEDEGDDDEGESAE